MQRRPETRNPVGPAGAVATESPWDRKTGFAPRGCAVDLGRPGARAGLGERSLQMRRVLKGARAAGGFP